MALGREWVKDNLENNFMRAYIYKFEFYNEMSTLTMNFSEIFSSKVETVKFKLFLLCANHDGATWNH